MPDGDWRQWADDTQTRVEQGLADARGRADGAAGFRAGMGQVRGRASSAYREVTVVTDVGGRLVDLQLAPQALRRDARELSRLVVATAELARRDAAEQVLTMAQAAFGAGSGVVTRLAAEVEAP